MDQDPNRITPGAATDEPVPSFNPDPAAAAQAPGGAPARFRSAEEETAYWRAYADGARAAAAASAHGPAHPHLPPAFDLDLTRDGREAGLTSSKLAEPWPAAPAAAAAASPAAPFATAPMPAPPPGSVRHDGWTDDKVRVFLNTLAATGSVSDACRACSMSRDSAYAFRGRASGEAFGLAWEAALLISRRAMADDLMSRARHGVIDRVYRNGELVAERHRHDNRLAMALLTRLDRAAEGFGARAEAIGAVAAEFDRFLDVLPAGNRGAEAFFAARFPADAKGNPAAPAEPTSAAGVPAPAGTEQARFARLAAYEAHGAALPAEADTSDLDPAEMERWSEEQLERAAFSGLLAALPETAWPEAARAEESDSNGMCKLCKLYRRYHPAGPAEDALEEGEEEDDFEGCSVWQDDEGEWITDFPPQDSSFDGYEEGEPGDPDYRRSLTECEKGILGIDELTQTWERADRVAAQRAAFQRYLELDEEEDEEDEEDEEAPDPEPAEPDPSPMDRLDFQCQRSGGEGAEQAQHLDQVPRHPSDAVEAFAAIAAMLRKRSEGC